MTLARQSSSETAPATAAWADWLVVGIGFFALALGFSARSVIGLAMPLIEQELHWSRTVVSDGAAWGLIVIAIMAPIAGNLVDRFGARMLLSVGLAAVGLGALATSAVHTTWQFYLAYGGVAAVGFGMVATHVVSTIVSQRFEAHRGLAVGIATSGSTAGQLLVVPLLGHLLETTTWRSSYVALGLICVLLVPVVAILMRGSHRPRAVHATSGDRLGERLRRILSSWTFHALFWSYLICGFTSTGVIETHLLPYAELCGFPPVESGAAFGVLSAVNLGGMILAGWLTDRMSRPLLLAIIYGARGLTFLLLAHIGNSTGLLFAFAVIFGLFDYSTVPPTVSLVASHLGLRVTGLAMGMLSSGHALGAAAGVFMAGRLFDLLGRYDWTWLASFGVAVLAAFLALTIREDRSGRLMPAPAH
jgi:MFS family permease